MGVIVPDGKNSLAGSGFRMPHTTTTAEKAGVFIRLNKTVGPYGAVLFFFALAICGAICVLAVWVRQDVAKPIVDGHLRYLNEQSERAKVIEGTQVSIRDALEETVSQLKGLNEAATKTQEMLATTQELLKAQTEWHRRSTEEQRKTNNLLQTGRIKVSNGPETADGSKPMPMDNQD